MQTKLPYLPQWQRWLVPERPTLSDAKEVGNQLSFGKRNVDMLAQALDCVVMICDILSNESGWAWGTDRMQYNQVREALISKDASLLESRVMATGRALCKMMIPNVDSDCIAAMGWCLGGQPC
jgi:hypothetical protein